MQIKEETKCLRYNLRTIEYIEYLVACVLVTVIITFLTLNILGTGDLSLILIGFSAILSYILSYYLFLGKLEICIQNNKKIHLKWIKKPLFRSERERIIDVNNLIKITMHEESLIRHRSYLICQFVEKKSNFSFNIKKSEVFGNKELVIFYSALEDFIKIINREIEPENQIKTKIDLKTLDYYRKRFII